MKLKIGDIKLINNYNYLVLNTYENYALIISLTDDKEEPKMLIVEDTNENNDLLTVVKNKDKISEILNKMMIKK